MCSVNIATGRRIGWPDCSIENDPASRPKRVFIVGGGPGGMEAARVAALRGHEVTLFERRDRLGGALIEASVPEFKSDLRPLIDYLSNQLKRLKVQVILKKEIAPKEITDSTRTPSSCPLEVKLRCRKSRIQNRLWSMVGHL
jgi:2-enoate reductase